ncbi:MAG: hypothetical protein M1840_004087 [Geoglossum simile]|nr:MAG: hypothetical protein M1840_004087 [Geoglossum simile]
MSGIEIAGAVLGGLPLIISALEHYNDGLQRIKDVWNFRVVLEDFTQDLRVQNAIYKATLAEFLQHTQSELEVSRLLQDPSGQEWSNTGLEMSLRKQYGEHYELYCQRIAKMNSVVEDLRDRVGKLHIEGGQSDDAMRQVRAVFRKIDFCLSKDSREELVGRLKGYIREFRELYESDVKTAEIKPRLKIRDSFRQTRNHASSIHNVLRTGWSCGCLGAHNAYFQLGQHSQYTRPEDPHESDTEYVILFSLDREPKSVAQPGPYEWSEAKVRVLDFPDEDESKCPHIRSQPTSTLPSSSLSGLLKASKSSLKSALKRVKFAEGKKKAYLNNRRQADLLNGDMPVCLTPPGLTFYLSTPLRSPKMPPPKVHFLQAPSQILCPTRTRNNQPGLEEIKSLCVALRGRSENPQCLGFRNDLYSGRQVTFYHGTRRHTSQIREPISLKDILSEKSPNKPRPGLGAIINLSAILASALLQLHTTPWLGRGWSTSDIVFLGRDHYLNQAITTAPPFLCKRYMPSAPPADSHDPSVRIDNTQCILALGIVLLELCFQQSFDDRADFNLNSKHDYYGIRIAAIKWLKEIPSEFEFLEYDKIVRRCLNCEFDQDLNEENMSLVNDKLRNSVYSHIVSPLEWLASQAST